MPASQLSSADACDRLTFSRIIVTTLSPGAAGAGAAGSTAAATAAVLFGGGCDVVPATAAALSAIAAALSAVELTPRSMAVVLAASLQGIRSATSQT